MTMKPDNAVDRNEERDIARLLRAAGKREQLPEQLRQNWESHFRQQLQQGRKRRRAGFLMMAAAALLLVAVAGIWSLPGPAPLQPWRVAVVYVDGAGLRADGRILRPGDTLSSPVSLVTDTSTRVALRINGQDVRLNRATALRLSGGRWRLSSGQLYVSTTNFAAVGSLLIETPFGEVRDVGTQFVLSLRAEQLIARVRRGVIALRHNGEEYVANAELAGPRKISVNRAAGVEISAARGRGANWQWIHQSGPGFKLEGKSVFDFLRWVSEESGLGLNFESQAAEIYARTTLMHGDFGRLDPLQAMATVLLSTDLQVVETTDDTISVSLSPRR